MDDVRLLLTDEIWARLVLIIKEVKSAAGAPPETSDRLFVEAVLYRTRTGIPWRDLPKCFGAWDAVYQRFRRWEKSGIWKALVDRIPAEGLAAIKAIFIDSTIIRAHQHAAGATAKKGGKLSRVWAEAEVVSLPRSTLQPRMKKRLLLSC